MAIDWHPTRVAKSTRRAWHAPVNGEHQGYIAHNGTTHAVIYHHDNEWHGAVNMKRINIPKEHRGSARTAAQYVVNSHIGDRARERNRDAKVREILAKEDFAASMLEACGPFGSGETEAEKLAAGKARARKQRIQKNVIDEATASEAEKNRQSIAMKGDAAHARVHGKKLERAFAKSYEKLKKATLKEEEVDEGKTYHHVFYRDPDSKWAHHFSADTKDDAADETEYLRRSYPKTKIKVVRSPHDPMHILKGLNESVEDLEEMRVEPGTKPNSPVVAHFTKIGPEHAGKTYRKRFNNMSHLVKWKKEKVNLHSIKRVFNESVEEDVLNELSDKLLDRYRQKAFDDQPPGDDGSDKYRKRKFGRDLAFSKQTGRAKVLATRKRVFNEEVED